jgi:RNA polymerase sigma factor (sigma-70 family)
MLEATTTSAGDPNPCWDSVSIEAAISGRRRMSGTRESADEILVPPRLRQIESVVRRVRPELVRVLRRFRIPPEDARDLIQEVCLAYVSKADGIADPDFWFVGALRRSCLMFIRSERRRLYDAVDEALLDLASCPEEVPQERESLLASLGRRIRELGERCRELLWLRYRMGYDRGEAATQLGVRASSIGTLERRCIAELSERILATEAGGR